MTQSVRSENRGEDFYPLEGYKPKPHRFTISDLERMIEVGIIREGARVELMEGELLEMNAMFNPHYQAVLSLDDEFRERFQGKARIANQLPIRLENGNQPLPDFHLLPLTHARNRIAEAHESLLLVEISDSTLRYDQNQKLHNYALSKGREYWIIDLKNRRLEIHRRPLGRDYLEKVTLFPGQTVRPLEFPEVEVHWDVALMDPDSTELETTPDDSGG